MKFKIIIFITAFLFSMHMTFAQRNHELKLDLSAISKHYILSYESILTNRISIEFGLGFDFRNLYLSETDFTSFTTTYHKFSATFMDPSLGGKYYFVINESGSGFFIGPYARLKYLLSREEGYVEKWEEVYDSKPSERQISNSGVRNLQYGIYTGGKLIIKKHFLIEFSMAYTRDREIGIAARNSTIYNTRYSIKLGYRL